MIEIELKKVNTDSHGNCLPYIEADFNGQILNCLVDTGASVSFIDEKFSHENFESLAVVEEYVEDMFLNGRSRLIRRIRPSNILIINKNIDWDLYESDLDFIQSLEDNEVRFKVILGFDFWKAHHATIFFEKSVIKFGL